MSVHTAEGTLIGGEDYLAFYAAQAQKVLDPANIDPHTYEEAVAQIDAGRMPNQAGVVEMPGGLAALDLVSLEFVGADELIVHPGDKSFVGKTDKRILGVGDLLLSMPEDILRPFGRSVYRPRQADWSRVGRRQPDRRPMTYAHRHNQPQENGIEVVRFEEGRMPDYRVLRIQNDGVIISRRLDD